MLFYFRCINNHSYKVAKHSFDANKLIKNVKLSGSMMPIIIIQSDIINT